MVIGGVILMISTKLNIINTAEIQKSGIAVPFSPHAPVSPIDQYFIMIYRLYSKIHNFEN